MQNPVYKFVLLWPLAIFHVQQSLRLYPPAGQTFREVSKENYEIAGYPVPKGTRCWSPYTYLSLHSRNSRIAEIIFLTFVKFKPITGICTFL